MKLFKKDESKTNINEDKEILKKYQGESLKDKETILKEYQSDILGLSSNEAGKRLLKNGRNIVVKDDNKTFLYFLLNAFKDEFIIILLVLSVINFLLGDTLGSLIIIVIATISALIRYFQDYAAYKFNKKLKSSISSMVTVIRNKEEKETKVSNVVVGDIIKLNAGTIIPADLRIIDAKDLFLDQAVFTGESVLVEKVSDCSSPYHEIFDIPNVALMGSSVVSGLGTGVVINTGFDTYLGKVGNKVTTKKTETNFDKGIKQISKLLIRYMIVVCLVVIVIDGIIKQNINEAMLFALSVAVGITPSMLPMILNVNLTKGSQALAKKNTLVKKIDAIQNLGAIDILCTDKTGTLTENKIVLQKYIDARGIENKSILEYAYLNSYYGTGLKNLVDRAILTYGKENKIDEYIEKYEKIDEIPFDYNRKRQSIIVKNSKSYRMITKGALEEVLSVCTKIKLGQKIVDITKKHERIIEDKAREMADNGMQVIALASKTNCLNDSLEKDMVFIGFVAFLDPAKKDVKETLKNLANIGVRTKILTGDNPYATKNICNLVGLRTDNIMLGKDIDLLSDKELKKCIEDVSVFARMNPLQKERIVRLYKELGHVVGYMGDGVNDAPSLATADIGISVNSATSIAKEASDIILLEKNLKVVFNGVVEGRKVYGNIIKYMKMALSSDFGDVFSIFIASIFLPFLPLLPIQMLLQDFLYDFSQIAIPYDNVDKEFLLKPRKWNTKGLGTFMNVMGPISSIIDVLAFLAFWFILGYNNIASESYFQTAWFVECLISETLIIHFVRTSKIPFVQSRANPILTALTMVTIIGTIITPILFHNISSFHFEILSIKFYLYLLSLVILYVLIVSIVKRIYIKKNHEWL